MISKQWGIFRTLRHTGDSVLTASGERESLWWRRALWRPDYRLLTAPLITPDRQAKHKSIQSLSRYPGMHNAALKPKIWKEKHTRHLFKRGTVPKGTEQSAHTYPLPLPSSQWGPVSSQGATLPQRKIHEYKRKWPRTHWWLPVLKLTHSFKI